MPSSHHASIVAQIERLAQLGPKFNGKTCLVYAPGPSLPELWLGRSSLHPKICVNDSWSDWRTKGSIGTIVPDADIVYGSDVKWWAARKGLPGFSGVKVCIVMGGQGHMIAQWPEIVQLRASPLGATGYDPELGRICHGSNSGCAAIHLAAQLGAKLIALIGFDWHGTHYFGPYPGGWAGPPFQYGRHFEILGQALASHGVEVINCTPGSVLTCFEQVSLDAVLERRAA